MASCTGQGDAPDSGKTQNLDIKGTKRSSLLPPPTSVHCHHGPPVPSQATLEPQVAERHRHRLQDQDMLQFRPSPGPNTN